MYHAEHLKRHIGEENCICTGTYVKIRLDAGADSKVVGHLEQADRFLVLNVEGKYAQIQITEAGSSSLDAHNGLSFICGTNSVIVPRLRAYDTTV